MLSRLERAVQQGEQALWEVVAEAYPEVTGGDYQGDLDEHVKTAVLHWLDLNAPQIDVGDRYRLRRPVSRHGCFGAVPVGRCGTVIAADEDLVQLRMDEPFEDGAEWDHTIQWSRDGDGEGSPAAVVFLEDCERVSSFEMLPTSLDVWACGACGAVVRGEDQAKHVRSCPARNNCNQQEGCR